MGIKSFRVELTVIVFSLMFLTSVFTVLVYILLQIFFPAFKSFNGLASSASTLIACTIIGTAAAAIFTKWVLSPLSEMIEATERISKGDFKVHIQETFDEKSDFGILQRSFNHMAAELDGIEMFRKDFINNFSHEFKTPIVSIQGFAHQLQAGGLSPVEEREYIRIIAAESDRLAKMATNILLLSKLENQAIVTDKTEFYLDEQLRTCLVLLEKQWASKEIELNIDLDEVRYRFNEDMLSQLWLNLFSNAIKFTPEGGTISCTLRADEHTVTVTVSDTGIGMSEETRQHIFDKFYQGDTSHTGAGNGIGLNIVSRILYLCKGSIQVQSEVGRGSTFTVSLPVTVPAYADVKEFES
ncbi:MAG: HAMP domain-containing histidine kinase [Clostridia bacterium]|nr:HAMP domain-containing histidine kinase [Clostridia bacterium]